MTAQNRTNQQNRQKLGTWQLFPGRSQLLAARFEGHSRVGGVAGPQAGLYKLPAAAEPFTHRNTANAPGPLLLLRVIE
jgi:hypothetical protein